MRISTTKSVRTLSLMLTIGSTILLVGAGAAEATVTIDPLTGRNGSMSFSGGTVTSIDGVLGNGLDITVGVDSLLNIATLGDCCTVGDEFALKLDGLTITPDASNPGGSSLFLASYLDIFLAAGTHTFEIIQTADCCGAGGGSYSFSSVAPVPEPGTALLMGLGLVGLGAQRRKVC